MSFNLCEFRFNYQTASNDLSITLHLAFELLNAMLHCVDDGILRDLTLEKIPDPMLRSILIDFILAAGDTVCMRLSTY